MEIVYLRLFTVGVGVFVIPVLVQAIITWSVTNHERKEDEKVASKARTFPYRYPLLKSTIPFLFDAVTLFQKASQTLGHLPAVRIGLINDDVYLIQGARNIAELFRTSWLSVTPAYGIALQYCFGMSRRAVSAYHADTSGCLPKPIPGSNVEPRDRVSYLTHENLLKGLLGPGLAPILERFESSFDETITKAPIDDEWQTLPSLQEFFEEHLGSAVIKALFGSALLDQNPVFLRDLWAFDQDVMSLAKRIPSFWIPDTYKLREKLRQCFKRWHASARAHTESNGTPQEEGDSVWGSQMIQERQQMLLGVQKQDHDSVAATDFGFLWAAVTNIVPSSMTMALHLFRDVPLLASIRREVGNAAEPTSRLGFDMERLLKQPQLLSMYAETLRYGVQIHVPRFSPHRDIQIGGTRIARNKFVLVNTMLAHEDESIWNTRDGARPLSEFWAQRFLVDPKDLHSGPTKRHRIPHTQSQSSDGIHFSAEGLEGAWIPYGGGHHACPGRTLAKRIMLLTCATMATAFDIEIVAEGKALEYSSPRFGFGVRKPQQRIPFRIRRRC